MDSKAFDFLCTTTFSRWDHLGVGGRGLEEGFSDPFFQDGKKVEAIDLVWDCSDIECGL